MPSIPDNHAAHDYAERIRERLPRRLQETREAAGLNMYALWLKCGVSRDTISRVEGGETIPGVHVLARLAWGRRSRTSLARSRTGRFDWQSNRLGTGNFDCQSKLRGRPEYQTNGPRGGCALIADKVDELIVMLRR